MQSLESFTAVYLHRDPTYWDRSGFALWHKRLEKQRFHWPKTHDERIIVSSTSDQLQKLLLGFDVFQKPHEYLQYNQIW